MRYSLLSRFRGVLVGSFLGEFLGTGGLYEPVLGNCSLKLPQLKESQSHPGLSGWSEIAACGSESLIRCGRFDLEDWVNRCFAPEQSLQSPKATARSSEVAVAMLPIALFFHEDVVKLRRQVLEAAAIWQHDAQISEGVLAMAYAISLALTEKLDCAGLIPQTIAYLGTSKTPLVQQLEKIQVLWEQGASLEATVTHLYRGFQRPNQLFTPVTDISIALAFYCFLDTPEDFRLCVSRASLSRYQSQMTATLCAALSGAYNSVLGIPVDWRLGANRLGIGIERQQLADKLLALWSGVYSISEQQQQQILSVAAPREIR
ncbi:MAG: ADP-ribosylglycohydrolase family protein [Symploca sp. SIO2E9]|nr:ADP-ribosylglycohydrolase family protein [Symploca sp. SIO2E9]